MTGAGGVEFAVEGTGRAVALVLEAGLDPVPQATSSMLTTIHSMRGATERDETFYLSSSSTACWSLGWPQNSVITPSRTWKT